jgi:hypothetical protein
MTLFAILNTGLIDTSGRFPLTSIDTHGKFTAGLSAININLMKDVTTDVVDTGGKLAIGIHDHKLAISVRGCTLSANIFPIFRKKIKKGCQWDYRWAGAR